jgi:streptothricin acetyltransferase
MGLMIKAHYPQTMGDAYGFDGSFLVESKLALFAEDGVISYQIIPVSPYEKCYPKNDPHVHLHAPEKLIFVALLDDLLVGRIVISEGWNRYAWVEDIAVDAGHRRAGVGRALMDRAVAWAFERRLPGIRLETQSNNVSACKFYESYGFCLGGFDRDLYRGLDEATTEIALFWYLSLRGGGVARQAAGATTL